MRTRSLPLALSLAGLLGSGGSVLAQGRLIAIGSGGPIYEVNPATGAATQIATSDAAPGTRGGLAFDCATNRLWLSSTGNDNLYLLNPDTGVSTLIGFYGDASVVMHGLEWDNSTSTLYGGSNGLLYSINTATGAATLIGSSGTTSFFNLGYHRRNNVLYGSSSSTDSLYTIDRATGVATLIGVLGAPSNPHAFAYNKDNGVLYLIDTGTNALYHIDVLTGAAHKVGDVPTTNILGLAYGSGDCAEPTVPNGAGYCTPYSVQPGQSILITATVLPVVSPASTGIQVTANLAALGGSATQVFSPGPNNTFTHTLNVSGSQAAGTYVVPLVIADAQARVGSGSIAVRIRPGPLPGFLVEAEPNDSKAAATTGVLTATGGVFGLSTGASITVPGDGSADYFKIQMPGAPPAIYRHRMVISTAGAAGHTGTIRGLTQTAGNINAGTDAALQTTSTTSTPPRFNQWYGFGRQEMLHYRVTGSASTSFEYSSALETSTVTPMELSGTLPPGTLTISRGAGNTTVIDMLVYDGQLNALSDVLHEGNAAGPNALSRSFSSGTYYLAVSNVNTTDSRPSPADSSARASSVLDFPDAVVNTSTTLVANAAMRFTAGATVLEVPASKDGIFDVIWIKFVVQGTGACCAPNGSCTTGLSSACTPGTYQGDGSTCTPGLCPIPPTGVCCRGATCNAAIPSGSCIGGGAAGASFVSAAAACNAGGSNTSPCCYADYNKVSGVTVTDIFAFLTDWFGGSAFAIPGGDGATGSPTVSNIFAFLGAWFAGGC